MLSFDKQFYWAFQVVLGVVSNDMSIDVKYWM